MTVTDSATHTATAPFTLPMSGILTITTAALPLATVNVFYSPTLAATGGDGVYTWSGTGLPTGLAISAAGVLSGSLSQAGPYPFRITVNDAQSSVASKNFTLLVSTGLPLSFVTQSLTSLRGQHELLQPDCRHGRRPALHLLAGFHRQPGRLLDFRRRIAQRHASLGRHDRHPRSRDRPA